MNSSINMDVVNRKAMQWKTEKEKNIEVKKVLLSRNKKAIEIDSKINKQIQETIHKSEIKNRIKLQNLEKLIQDEITAQQQDLNNSNYEDSVKKNFQRKSRNFSEMINEMLIKEENQKKQHHLFEEYRVIYTASMENFTLYFQRLSPESKQKCGHLKKIMLNLIGRYDTISSLTQFTSKELEAIDKICKELDCVNKELIEEERRASEESKKIQKQQQQQQQLQQQQLEKEQAAINQDTIDSNNRHERSAVVIPSNEEAQRQYGTIENMRRYEAFVSFSNTQSEAVKSFLEDPINEKIRFRYKKAINVPVNAINSVNSAHFIDKFDRLNALLNGNPVQVDNYQVSTNEHPDALTYCKILLAKKFVSQGEQVIPSQAFPIAAVVVALWQKYPDLGQLILAQFYMECPYLVPLNLPHVEGQSKADHLRNLGYRFENGTVENETNYLKRLSGICRLYFAIMISKSRRGVNQPNPFSIDNGWIWLTNILNLEPSSVEVYCTLIVEFLQIASAELLQSYRKQFFKIIFTIKNQYIPKLQAQCGPKARLEQLIENILQNNIPVPEGMLNNNFW